MGVNLDLKMGSEARLWQLIEERCGTGADVAAIDQRIWQLFGERWAVMFTDLTGFSRRSRQFGITHFLQIIFESKRVLYPVAAEHGGFLVKGEGDSLLFVFRSPVAALQAAVAMQRAAQKEDARRVAEEQFLPCIGVGYGDVLRVGEHEVWGHEVNMASKLGEDLAKPYEILVTTSVREAAEAARLAVALEPLELELFGDERGYRVQYR